MPRTNSMSSAWVSFLVLRRSRKVALRSSLERLASHRACASLWGTANELLFSRAILVVASRGPICFREFTLRPEISSRQWIALLAVWVLAHCSWLQIPPAQQLSADNGGHSFRRAPAVSASGPGRTRSRRFQSHELHDRPAAVLGFGDGFIKSVVATDRTFRRPKPIPKNGSTRARLPSPVSKRSIKKA